MKDVIIIVCIVSLTTGSMIGALETMQDRSEKGLGGCQYKSYASYFPSHWIVCELLRDRTK